jgi:hypothetical protein
MAEHDSAVGTSLRPEVVEVVPIAMVEALVERNERELGALRAELDEALRRAEADERRLSAHPAAAVFDESFEVGVLAHVAAIAPNQPSGWDEGGAPAAVPAVPTPEAAAAVAAQVPAVAVAVAAAEPVATAPEPAPTPAPAPAPVEPAPTPGVTEPVVAAHVAVEVPVPVAAHVPVEVPVPVAAPAPAAPPTTSVPPTTPASEPPGGLVDTVVLPAVVTSTSASGNGQPPVDTPAGPARPRTTVVDRDRSARVDPPLAPVAGAAPGVADPAPAPVGPSGPVLPTSVPTADVTVPTITPSTDWGPPPQAVSAAPAAVVAAAATSTTPSKHGRSGGWLARVPSRLLMQVGVLVVVVALLLFKLG